jgi:hypothetical protein
MKIYRDVKGQFRRTFILERTRSFYDLVDRAGAARRGWAAAGRSSGRYLLRLAREHREGIWAPSIATRLP